MGCWELVYVSHGLLAAAASSSCLFGRFGGKKYELVLVRHDP